MKETQSYYDEFSHRYEKHRHHGYHAFVDELEAELVAKYGTGGKVLEVGCGTGLILERAGKVASFACGMDLSPGMLKHTHAKGLTAVQASATALPFADDGFDLVYSFKVLAHVPQIGLALHEMARVTKPGGHLLIEFYNTHSLRYLIKRLRPPLPVSDRLVDNAVYTRYDSPETMKDRLPPSLELIGLRGVRIFTPLPKLLDLPVVGPLLTQLERWGADVPVLQGLGGFLVLVARKKG